MNDYATGEGPALTRASDTRAFAQTDAKRQALGADRSPPEMSRNTQRPTTELMQRISALTSFAENETNAIREIGYKLRSHTDALYGEEPKSTVERAQEARPGILPPTPLGQDGGEIGAIHGHLAALEIALLNLSEAHGFVSYQAGRASTFV